MAEETAPTGSRGAGGVGGSKGGGGAGDCPPPGSRSDNGGGGGVSCCKGASKMTVTEAGSTTSSGVVGMAERAREGTLFEFYARSVVSSESRPPFDSLFYSIPSSFRVEGGGEEGGERKGRGRNQEWHGGRRTLY